MSHDVFISHSVKDKVTADAVCAVLEGEGVRCWIAPRDVMPGMEWGECIIEAIEQTRVMVLVFTADANASPQIRREVERAVNHGVAILPVRIEDVLPGRALEYFIGNVHWLDALTPPLEAHLKNLAGTVKMLLARLDQNPPPMPHSAAGRVLHAAKSPEPAVAPPARHPAVPHMESHLAEDGQAAAATELPRAPLPVEFHKPLDSPEGPASPRLPRVPGWAWVSGVALALLLVAVFVGVHLNSHPAPEASPEPGAPPALAPNPASSPSPGGVPAGPLSVPKTAPAKKASPVTPGPSVATKPATASPRARAENTALLRDTMKALQGELNSIGTEKYTFVVGKTDGSSFQASYVNQFSNAVYDPTQCRISYHERLWYNGGAQPSLDQDQGLLPGDVTSVVVEPAVQVLSIGRQDWLVTSADPPVAEIFLRLLNGTNVDLSFTDAALAYRTAATLTQAVKLCGGHLAN